MKELFKQTSETDGRLSVDKSYRSLQACSSKDLPGLKMEFLIEDYDEIIEYIEKYTIKKIA